MINRRSSRERTSFPQSSLTCESAEEQIFFFYDAELITVADMIGAIREGLGRRLGCRELLSGFPKLFEQRMQSNEEQLDGSLVVGGTASGPSLPACALPPSGSAGRRSGQYPAGSALSPYREVLVRARCWRRW